MHVLLTAKSQTGRARIKAHGDVWLISGTSSDGTLWKLRAKSGIEIFVAIGSDPDFYVHEQVDLPLGRIP